MAFSWLAGEAVTVGRTRDPHVASACRFITAATWPAEVRRRAHCRCHGAVGERNTHSDRAPHSGHRRTRSAAPLFAKETDMKQQVLIASLALACIAASTVPAHAADPDAGGTHTVATASGDSGSGHTVRAMYERARAAVGRAVHRIEHHSDAGDGAR
jgi:hypothetical protein